MEANYGCNAFITDWPGDLVIISISIIRYVMQFTQLYVLQPFDVHQTKPQRYM